MTKNIKEILQQYWGYETFKPAQEDVIRELLADNDVLALLPTGGGKSICYQLTALLRDGICVVVSPLVALIDDQVNALKNRQLKAIGLSGSYNKIELQRLLDNARYGGYKYIYLSPERLQQEMVINYLKQMSISLIAIDEAHCISQWGHDFRPSYRNVNILREWHPDVPIIALTATATAEVTTDICKNLHLRNPKIIQKSFERKNITYSIHREVHKPQKLISLLQKNQESSIVYVYSRRESEQVAAQLRYSGITAQHFHGGLTNLEKSKCLNEWLHDRVKTMVATNAFGMGIDKADVRLVVHLGLPDSIENYYQESGRAGRDGNPAQAVLLLDANDISLSKKRFIDNLPQPSDLRQVYKALNTYFQIAYGDTDENIYPFDFQGFCNRYNLNNIKTYHSLKILNQHNIITLSEHFRESDKVQFLVEGNALRTYLKRVPALLDVAQSILRTYSGSYGNMINIEINRLAKKIQLSAEAYRKALKRMAQDGMITFDSNIYNHSISFLVTREDQYTISPLLKYLKKQKKTKIYRLQQMINYVTDDNCCRNIALLQYFGEKFDIPCGKCNFCQRKYVQQANQTTLQQEICIALETEPQSIDSLSEYLAIDKAIILPLLKSLLDEDFIIIDERGNYKIIA